MSIQQLAQYGRHGDDTLVHMGRDELAGLDAIARAHGGSLTINPHTGLPEAFSLKKVFKSVLPMIAGGLLSTVLTPAGAGLAVGAAKGLASGSLKKGLMAGLGAYGGAGLAESLSNAGAFAQAGNTYGSTAGELGLNASDAAKIGVDSAKQMVAAPVSMSNVGAGLRSLTQTGGLTGVEQGANIAAGKLAGAGAGQLMRYGSAAAAPFLGNASTSSGPDAPEQQDTTYYPYSFDWNQTAGDTMGGAQTYVNPQFTAGEPYTRTAAAGGVIEDQSRYNSGIAMLAGGGGATDVPIDPYTGTPGYKSGGSTAKPVTPIPKYEYDPVSRSFTAVGKAPTTTTTRTPTPGYGDVNPETGMSGASSDVFEYLMGRRPVSAPRSPVQITQTQTAPAPAAAPAAVPVAAPNAGYMGMNINPDQLQALVSQFHFAAGGRTRRRKKQHGRKAKGRFIKGAGDGVSDSIPAEIDSPHGKQPAKLATDEFVIPARVVAEIGNGSSDAGAKRLYAMLDRVEKRAKHAKRGEDSGAWRELPA